jgi:hypothetical protein
MNALKSPCSSLTKSSEQYATAAHKETFLNHETMVWINLMLLLRKTCGHPGVMQSKTRK